MCQRNEWNQPHSCNTSHAIDWTHDFIVEKEFYKSLMVPWYLTQCVKMQSSLSFFPTWHIWLFRTMEGTNSLLWFCLSFFLSDGAHGTMHNHGKMEQLVLIVVGHVLTTYVVRILPLAPMRYGSNLKMVFFKLKDGYIYIFIYIYVSGNGLMPSGTKPFTLTNVDQIMCRHIALLGASKFYRDTSRLEVGRLLPLR